MTTRTCKKCGGRLVSRKGRTGWYTMHMDGPCTASQRIPTPRDPDAEAEYRAGATGFTEYANEVRGFNDYRD